jgi:hypothetical protein
MIQIQSVSDLVSQIKLAVQQAQSSLEKSGVRITRIDLEIKTALEASGEAGMNLKIIPMDLSGKYKRSVLRTIRLSMVPVPATIQLFAPISDELRDAMLVVCEAVQQASGSQPKFQLTEAIVGLAIAVDKEGAIKVIIGSAVDESTTHNISMTLIPIET